MVNKILIIIILLIIGSWAVWQFWPESKSSETAQVVYTDNQIEVKKDNKDYIVWRTPDAVTDNTLYAYKLYSDSDCQLMYIFENEYPAGRKLAKLRLCQDTIAKFYYLDNGYLVAQTAKCGIEYRLNIYTKQEEIIADQNLCQGSLIIVK